MNAAFGTLHFLYLNIRNFHMAEEKHKPKILLLYCGGTLTMVGPPLKVPEAPEPFVAEVRAMVSDLADIEWAFITNIDSSNMRPKDYADIVRTIYYNYAKYDGFVITHGTDTMTYTASALSYMLENLNKPVVLTGSQKPLSSEDSDAKRNLVDAFTVASTSDLAEVVICFNRNIWRGNRAMKVDAQGFDAFNTPDFPRLGYIDTSKHGKVVLESHAVTASPDRGSLTLRTGISPNVAFVRFNPLNPRAEERIRSYADAKVSGILFAWEGEGGNFTKGKDNPLLGAIKYATERGVPVVVTHSWAAKFGENYRERIAALVDAGAIPALDMEAYPALAKLMWCAGQAEGLEGMDKVKKIGEMFATDYRGEVNPNFDPVLVRRMAERKPAKLAL